jgi:hypothetical protein
MLEVSGIPVTLPPPPPVCGMSSQLVNGDNNISSNSLSSNSMYGTLEHGRRRSDSSDVRSDVECPSVPVECVSSLLALLLRG